jgi:ABC-type Mn2+/Zn2+ transport system permease subunit
MRYFSIIIIIIIIIIITLITSFIIGTCYHPVNISAFDELNAKVRFVSVR